MTQNRFILAAGVSLAMVLTFSCSSDGSDGKDGAQGLQGETGAGCIVSSVDEGTKITCGASTVIIPNGSQGEPGNDGNQGPKGDTGEDGAGCTVESVDEGTEVTCGENSVIIPNGSDGEGCSVEKYDDGGIVITCGKDKVGLGTCGGVSYDPLENNILCEEDVLVYKFRDDRDGERYAYVEIGDYIWMAENLVYGKADGKYTWAEALEACPAGWELPELSVIQELVSADASKLNLSSNDFWWSSTELEGYNEAYAMQTNSSGVFLSSGSSIARDKINPYFVRCVKAN